MNASNQRLAYMPAIINFLGYNPLPPAQTIAEQLVQHRTSLGLMHKESAKLLDVDQGQQYS